MKKSSITWLAVAVVAVAAGVLLLGGGGGKGNGNAVPAGTPAPSSTAAANAPSSPVLTIATSSALGPYLVATNGMTLYRYTVDTTNTSNCTGACALAWPPYTVAAGTSPTGDHGITGTIGLTTRADGTMQVTYKGMPLYFYARDTNRGDTNGQNVGNVWFVEQP